MQEALDVHNSDLDKAKAEGVTINQLLMGGNFQQRIKQHLELTQTQLNEQLEIVELKRHELTQATQKKRVLEILKEKEIEKFKAETERLDRLEADEIAQNYRRDIQS
jgi:flagellar export protein FliJ